MINTQDGPTTDDRTYMRKRVRRVTEPTTTVVTSSSGKPLPLNERGFLSFSKEQWIEQPKEIQTFVQRYNSRMKHHQNMDTLEIPPGLEITKSKIRRLGEKEDDSEVEDVTLDNRHARRQKKIVLDLQSTDGQYE